MVVRRIPLEEKNEDYVKRLFRTKDTLKPEDFSFDDDRIIVFLKLGKNKRGLRASGGRLANKQRGSYAVRVVQEIADVVGRYDVYERPNEELNSKGVNVVYCDNIGDLDESGEHLRRAYRELNECLRGIDGMTGVKG